ncbi:MAG TPA: family 1 glycosylhydrolase [Allosphingosinicella sp.]|nr:family 1 glycosylhydrolase [Allosphingosinicella sp.]
MECTIVRLGDGFRDQSAETGHDLRPGDIDLIADLGIRTVRYPILWERVAPERPDRMDFGWTDERLERLRERGIRVIAGLLHHGSGPPYTNLVDADFSARFGDYAARVAERYPWIDMWTPVNEPLTTARFSGLYGHWYPHGRDYRSFLRALVNQCKATLEAMRAIRAVNPDALLIQTEDLGKTFSTAPLRHQAAHENERRWLSFDLLCGRVTEGHALRRNLLDAGIGEEELELLAGGEARPDMLGINHYLTSERFLDHRLGHYPWLEAGGNGRDSYVDAEAVRVKRLGADTGLAPRLRETWARYGIPMAVTEVHHGCTRDEQLRWFAEAWRTAAALRSEGMDLGAVTLWAMFGTVDWRSLLTASEGLYDVGAFDVRSPEPRPTAVAKAAKAFAAGETFDHPVLDISGWWRRPQRLYPWHGSCKSLGTDGRRLLITGATGTLGQAFARICEHRGLPFCLTARDELDLCDESSIAAAMATHDPWAVINTAGFVRVADAEREPDACMAANAEGARTLARACARAGVKLVTFSSDLVFDGRDGRPYSESDPTAPGCVYGRSKAYAERLVLEALPDALVVRTSAFFGPWDRYNFAWDILSRLGRGEPVEACSRTRVSPTFVPDLCHSVLDLLIDRESGIWHLANQGGLSWHEFACLLAEGAGFDRRSIRKLELAPESSTALTSERGLLLRPLDRAIAAYLTDVAEALRPPASLAAE